MRILYIIVFLGVVLPVVFFAHRHVWRRLVRDTGLVGPLRHAATGAIVTGALLLLAGWGLRRVMPREQAELLAIVAFSWMGLVAFALTFMLPWDIMRISAWWKGRQARRAEKRGEPVPDAAPEDPARRQFLARVAAGTTAAGAGGLFFIGAANALGEIDTVDVPIRLPRLPKALDGLRIAQLTDVHIGPILNARFLDGVVEKVNALKPDVVVITGDLVDGSTDLIGPDVARLSRLRSRYGTYFCTGNHEYYSGAEEWVAFLERHGIRVLTNERVSIGDRASFDLAGIPDIQAARFDLAHPPDLAKAVAGRDPERELVLLAHRPNPIVDAARHQVGLQISGHTHGGQFFPITLGAKLVHPYNAGLHHHNDLTQIYVSRGTGFWGPPVRILAPAEITNLILTV